MFSVCIFGKALIIKCIIKCIHGVFLSTFQANEFCDY